MDTIKIESKQTKMVAHRGLSGLERENTCAAFVAAGNRDYFGIETDVHVTSDSQFIIIHDNTTERVTGINLEVEQSTLAQLRELRLTDMDGKVRQDLCLPSLDEYLRICKKYGKKPVLELKSYIPKKDIARMLQVVKDNIEPGEMIFISFDYRNLVALRNLEPEAQLQYLYGQPVDDALVKQLLACRCDLDIYYPSITKEAVEMLHKKGILVNCWTVDDPTAAAALIEMGVDFITSNILQ